jgi:hypothetical protein
LAIDRSAIAEATVFPKPKHTDRVKVVPKMWLTWTIGQARRTPAVPMQNLLQANLGEGGDRFRIQQAAAAALVQSHVSGDPPEEGNL